MRDDRVDVGIRELRLRRHRPEVPVMWRHAACDRTTKGVVTMVAGLVGLIEQRRPHIGPRAGRSMARGARGGVHVRATITAR